VNDLQEICQWLLDNTNALSILLLDKSGATLARAGAETDHRALLPDADTQERFEQRGEQTLHVSAVAERAVLVVVFDARSSLGLVRLRVKKAAEEMQKAFQ
jgi:predicted regulator of Ras-like GTPase activity (Roadblock/LC7/MglB family)